MPEQVISVRGLVKRYDKTVAVNGIDLDIFRGECVGVLGPNGAGKSTTLEILEGLHPQTEGKVELFGMTWDKEPEKIRLRIGVQLQETRFQPLITVEEAVKMFRSFYPSGLGTEETISILQLESKRDTYTSRLSGGQRQRLAIATALVGNPEIVFLDEPTTGLDPQSRSALWDIIRKLKADGRTVLLTTHYMQEAQMLCDRLYIVDHGKIIATGTPDELLRKFGGSYQLLVRTDPALDMARLSALPGASNATVRDGQVAIALEDPNAALPALLNEIRDQGAKLRSLNTYQPSLEDVFLSLTGHALREDKNP